MLGRYTGPLILREPEPMNPLHKQYPYRGYWTQSGFPAEIRPLRNMHVAIEQEIAEIRARHALRREYNRMARAARVARQALQKANNHVTADHRALDESDA